MEDYLQRRFHGPKNSWSAPRFEPATFRPMPVHDSSLALVVDRILSHHGRALSSCQYPDGPLAVAKQLPRGFSGLCLGRKERVGMHGFTYNPTLPGQPNNGSVYLKLICRTCLKSLPCTKNISRVFPQDLQWPTTI